MTMNIQNLHMIKAELNSLQTHCIDDIFSNNELEKTIFQEMSTSISNIALIYFDSREESDNVNYFSKLSHQNLLFLKNTFRLGLRDFIEDEASLNNNTLSDNDNMLIDIADKVINEYQPDHKSTLGSSSTKISKTGKSPPKKKNNQPRPPATLDTVDRNKLFKSVMRCIVSRWQNEVEQHLSQLMFELLMKNNSELEVVKQNTIDIKGQLGHIQRLLERGSSGGGKSPSKGIQHTSKHQDVNRINREKYESDVADTEREFHNIEIEQEKYMKDKPAQQRKKNMQSAGLSKVYLKRVGTKY